MTATKTYFRIPEAAAYSNLSIGSLRRAIADGRLKARRPLPRGPWLIEPADLDAFVRGDPEEVPQLTVPRKKAPGKATSNLLSTAMKAAAKVDMLGRALAGKPKLDTAESNQLALAAAIAEAEQSELALAEAGPADGARVDC